MEELQRMKQGRPMTTHRSGSGVGNGRGNGNAPKAKGALHNKRVFVTGGAYGIGEAMVKAFRDVGCRVAFCDRDRKRGAATAQAYGARFYPLDVVDADALSDALESLTAEWEDIDIVVNNVGVSEFIPLTECEVSDFERVLRTNLLPVFITGRYLARHRKARAYGRIINIASTRHAMSEANTEAYSASKGAIVSLTHALMMSLSPLGITVNSISPGWIECDNSSLREEDNRFHPSLRVGVPADVARLALFIAHPDNDFINGEDFRLDGGVSHKMIYPE